MKILRPPSVEEKFGRPYALWWAGNRRARSLVKTGGVWYEVDYPGLLELQEAEQSFLGGHEYEITDAEAAQLISEYAPFADYIDTI